MAAFLVNAHRGRKGRRRIRRSLTDRPAPSLYKDDPARGRWNMGWWRRRWRSSIRSWWA